MSQPFRSVTNGERTAWIGHNKPPVPQYSQVGGFPVWIGTIYDVLDYTPRLPNGDPFDWVITVCDWAPVGLSQHVVCRVENGPGEKVKIDPALALLGKLYLQGARTLVHCWGGVDRSPTFVLAWLCRYRGYSLAEAQDGIRMSRPQATPHPEWGWHRG